MSESKSALLKIYKEAYAQGSDDRLSSLIDACELAIKLGKTEKLSLPELIGMLKEWGSIAPMIDEATKDIEKCLNQSKT